MVDNSSMSDDISETSISNLVDIKANTKFEVISYENTYKNYNNKNRLSRPYLTKFEKSKIIGVRAQQIANNSTPLIEVKRGMTVMDIVQQEFKEKKIPLIIRRYFTDNTYEDWRLRDLIYSA